MMRLTRLELQDVGPFERLEVDLHARTVVKGANAQGKTTILRAIACLIGASGESAQALVRTDEAGVPVEGAVPQIVGYMEGDGERYKITRRAKKLIVQRWEVPGAVDGPIGAWRTLEPPDKELARIFDRDSSPSALLDERLSDDKRVGLILEVAEASGYDREKALFRAGLHPSGRTELFVPLDHPDDLVQRVKTTMLDFTLQPIPAGLHPLEDLEKVIGQVFDARTDVERARKAAASAAERLATGLTADAPADVAVLIATAQDAVDMVKGHLAKSASDLKARVSEWQERAEAQIARIRADLQSEVEKMRAEERASVEQLQAMLMTNTRKLAELRTTQEIVVADKARRDESEKARAEAQALAARHAALTRAIQSLKTQAAQFISDSFPGVKVDITEEGKRVLMVHGDNGWKTWGSTNTGRLQEIAAAWSVLHQEKRGAQGVPMLGLVLLDRGESLDPVKIDALGAAGQLIVTLRTPGELTFEEA